MMGVAVPNWRTDAAADVVAVRLSVREERACRAIGRAALAALYTELWACPKPGLVSLVDNGSHADMDAFTFLRSLSALRGYFAQVACAGMGGAGFDELRRAGMGAEARMLGATGNVNTHRGAIFTLGLLASAAGRIFCTGGSFDGDALGSTAAGRWGKAILAASPGSPWSHGQLVSRRYGASGAREEAAAGFPHVFAVGLPALRRALAKAVDLNAAVVQAFFSLMAVVPDNNLLFRGGTKGLSYARRLARSFLARGGVYRENWQEDGRSIHRALVARRLSPGGSADLLAAAIFVHCIQTNVSFYP
jgi:triphosphoribosyl-dephospho-CoA synthase